MTAALKQTLEEQPRFLDTLCAAILTLWFITSLGLCISFIIQDSRTLWDAIATSVFLLCIGGPIAFILSGVVSLPMWVLCKICLTLNRNIATVIGGLTGLIIATSYVSTVPFDYAGTFTLTSKEGLITLGVMSILGGISGWNGYRFAWNGRRMKEKTA